MFSLENNLQVGPGELTHRFARLKGVGSVALDEGLAQGNDMLVGRKSFFFHHSKKSHQAAPFYLGAPRHL